jgi:regulator of PEP synthase PpsR (kinase-PPPase family)
MKQHHLALLSDSTGDLGERIIRALISQFPPKAFTFRVYSFISDADVSKIISVIKHDKAILFHTVIHDEMKKKIHNLAKEYGLEDFDITGGALKFLEKVSGLTSQPNLKSLHELNPEYDQRIAALSYTVAHDDGMGAASLDKADIILTGVSRTSKTPTGIYLANKGFKVGNVPIVKGIPFHEGIKGNLIKHLVGLTIEPSKLRNIRLMRAQQERIPGPNYYDVEKIKEELTYAQNIFLELGCPIIDVTNHAVEETAALVQKVLHLR